MKLLMLLADLSAIVAFAAMSNTQIPMAKSRFGKGVSRGRYAQFNEGSGGKCGIDLIVCLLAAFRLMQPIYHCHPYHSPVL